MEFYGFMPWIIIQRITLPLCVFFRFHSTVVLSELWKQCYRIERGSNHEKERKTTKAELKGNN